MKLVLTSLKSPSEQEMLYGNECVEMNPCNAGALQKAGLVAQGLLLSIVSVSECPSSLKASEAWLGGIGALGSLIWWGATSPQQGVGSGWVLRSLPNQPFCDSIRQVNLVWGFSEMFLTGKP